MKPLLLLVDLQQDFLSSPGLEPAAGDVVRAASRLLDGFRARGLPVAHAVTTVRRAGDDRMPHWKRAGRWLCIEGSAGHAAPPVLRPLASERVVEKQFFSGFSAPELERVVAGCGADLLVLAGVHLHGCVRATALDAYARGLGVWIAADAVASDDPLHAAITRRYLSDRAARVAPASDLLASLDGAPRDSSAPESRYPAATVAGLAIPGTLDAPFVHRSPRDASRVLFAAASGGAREALAAASAARAALADWRRRPASAKREILEGAAASLESRAEMLASRLAVEVGKPIDLGLSEVRRAAAILRLAAGNDAASSKPGSTRPRAASRRVPLGVVAIVTPWNNPVAIPLGKIAAALVLDNAVVWKPAPAATGVAFELLELLRGCGLPDGVVNLVSGGADASIEVMRCAEVDGVALTGSSLAGWAAQEICARRRIPLQAELGGNNAAIVWDGADSSGAAGAIARGAFSFAGQRCTANRRAIVSQRVWTSFVDLLVEETAACRWGDPREAGIEAGPLISGEAKERVAAAVEAAGSRSESVRSPRRGSADAARLEAQGFYYPPTLVVAPEPSAEIVHEETFGPVLVVQRARDFEEALELADAPRQGLVAALFGGSDGERRRFGGRIRAGVLKWDASTCDVDLSSPFGGWKASGVGPPERGDGDVEFYTRAQALSGSV